MSIIGKLIKTAVDVVTLPISVVADIATLAGAITERDEPYTLSHGKTIINDVVDVIDEAEKL